MPENVLKIMNWSVHTPSASANEPQHTLDPKFNREVSNSTFMYHVSPLHSVRQVKCISSLRSSMNCGNICRETANGNCKTLRNDEIIQYFCHETTEITGI